MVAQSVAKALRWTLLDRALITAVATAAHVDPETAGRYDEHIDSWWHRFNRGGLWAAAVWAGASVADAEIFDADTCAAFAQRVIAETAEAGDCVIVGRGSQCILRDREDALHVFIHGPWHERVSRVRRRVDSTGNIGELIRLTDHERASYIHTYYGCDWKNPYLYHIMISSQIGIENSARIIVDAVMRGGET